MQLFAVPALVYFPQFYLSPPPLLLFFSKAQNSTRRRRKSEDWKTEDHGTIHRPKARKEPPRCLLVLFFEQDSLFLPRYSWAFINGGLVGLRLADSLSLSLQPSAPHTRPPSRVRTVWRPLRPFLGALVGAGNLLSRPKDG